MIVLDSCEWQSPGAHPYTGTREAAIYAMPLPEPARKRLAERPAGSYDYVVTVDSDSVTARGAEFEREVAFMNFGDGSKVCADVKRNTWKPEHAETAIVYCDAISGFCVGKFSICNNWSIFTRKPEKARPPVEAKIVSFDADVPELPPAVTIPEAPAAVAAIPTTFEGFAVGYAFGSGNVASGGGFGGGGGGGYGGPCCTPCPTVDVPIAPVPEPETWAAMLLGLGVLGAIGRKRTR